MIYQSKKKLRKLSDREIFDDVKNYIQSSQTFYETRIPEIEVLAKRLHEEYRLKEFYRVFNKLWNAGYQEERSLAIYTLQLYKEDFDIETWKFIKNKLKDIKSWNKADIVGLNIIGEILLRSFKMKNEVLKLGESKNAWFRRMAIISLLPLIKKETEFPLKIIERHIDDEEKPVQNAIGLVLKEISSLRPFIAKKFILKNMNMPLAIFDLATENFKELRKLRDLKKLNDNGANRLFFWKKI